MEFTLDILVYLLGVTAVCEGLKGFHGIPVLFPGDVIESERDVKFAEPDANKDSFNQPVEPNPTAFSLEYYDELTDNGINSIENEAASAPFIQKEAPLCVKGSSHEGLCEDDSEYNSEIRDRFNQALKNINLSEELYDKVLSKIMTDLPGPISSRIGNDIREDPVCPATERIIFPKRGKRESGDYVFLLNQDNVKQGIKIEECINFTRLGRQSTFNDMSCSLTSDTGSQSVCRQKYILKNMLSLGPAGMNIVTESILIPSCCACLRKVTANRVGSGNVFEFDEKGNLITEPGVNAQTNTYSINDNTNKENSNYEGNYTKNVIDLLIYEKSGDAAKP